MVRYTAICLDKLVMKAMRRLAKVRYAVYFDNTGDCNAKENCCELMCEGQCDEDSAEVRFSEAQRQASVMAVRR